MRSDRNVSSLLPAGLLVAAALAAYPLAAQNKDETAPRKPDAEQAERQAEAPAKPESRPSASDRVFVPSEEVSPDQEVDFPADL